MSSSSANAAALAAFQGLASRSKSELIHDKKNPQKFKIPLNIDTNLPKIDRKLSISSKRSQGPSTMKRSSSQNLQTPGVKPQLQLPIQLPKIRTTAEGGGLVLPTRLALMSLTSQFKLPTRPLSSPLQRQAPSLPTVPLSVSTSSAASASVAATAALIAALSLNLNLNLNLDVPTTPVQRSQSYRKILPSGSASILESLDYFNAQTQNSQKSTPSSQDMINNVKKSIGSKMKIASMESTNSREMINQVKQSINSKATKAPSKDESFQKQQVRIQEIRDSIDQKRIQTQSPLYSTSSVSGQFPQPNLSTEFFERNSNSYSSIGSSLHSNGSDLVLLRPLTPIAMDPTPKIVVGEHGNKLRNSIVQVEGSPTRNGEELVPSIGNDGLAESIFLEKRAPRRKPPPQSSPKEQQEELNNDNYDSYSFFSELPSFNPPKTPVIDSYSSKSLFEIPPIDTPPERAESTSSFPQFPNIFNKKSKENGDVKKNRHSFWGHRKVSQEYDTTNEDTESEYYDKDDDDLPISLADTPPPPRIIQPRQTVQLKTTMRTTNKRKEKKTFNENKPWKNHNDLTYITELERKRYEGVWVSNKGLYLTSVVTKLTGVDYTTEKENEKEKEKEKSKEIVTEIVKDKDNDNDKDKEIIAAEEASKKAAKLSSQVTQENILTDPDNFHNISQADITQLIHGCVVKRIWLRSRLPTATLESIWNLVDFRHDGTLNKPEFLVGMWLVDQSLYGRKLPKVVDPIVWDSLGSIGLNVVVKKKGRR